MSEGPLNSATPTTSFVVGAVHNIISPTPGDGKACALQLDANGNLLVNVAVGGGGGGGGGNVNITGINGNPPALTNPFPVELSDGTNAFGTAGNPLSVNVISGGGSNASIGTNGAAAPASSTQVGGSDGVNLQPLQVDASKNLKVIVNTALPAGSNVIGHVITDSGSTTAVTGTVAVTQSTSPWVVSGTVAFSNTTIAVTNAGTFAVQSAIADGADVTQGAKADARSAATDTTAVSIMSVLKEISFMEQNPASRAVTNAGTFAVQATLAAETTKVIGTVNQGTSPWVDNVSQWGGTNVVTGGVNGSVGVGGLAATGAAVAGNPVYIAGKDTSGNVQPISTFTSGNGGAILIGSTNTGADGASNANLAQLNNVGAFQPLPAAPFVFNGTTWDRIRSAGIGNAVAATGLPTAVGYVQYNTTLPAPTAAQYTAAQCDTVGSTYVNTEGRKATYSCFASFTAVAGDIAVLPGSASKTIRVIRVEVSFVTTGTAAVETVQLVKRSAADTGGTSSAMTAVPHDSGFAGASAAPLSYTVAPTPGAAVGTIRGVQFNDASSALPGANTWIWDFGTRPSSAIVLRGVAQQLAISLPTAVATQTAQVSFEWTEE